MTEFKQIVGRGTRVHEDTKKYYFTLIDFRKATNHFADPDFDGEPVQIYEPGEEDPVTPPDDVLPADDGEDPIPPEPGDDEEVIVDGQPWQTDISLPPGTANEPPVKVYSGLPERVWVTTTGSGWVRDGESTSGSDPARIFQGRGGDCGMEDRQLYAKLLGIEFPWLISRVQVDMPAERIDVWVEEASGARFACAACQQDAPVYDHTAEQVWRHLDTCQCRTYVHASLPRTNCPKDGVKQVRSPWAEPRSQFTRLFEIRMIDTLKECDVTGVTRLIGTSWDEAWGVMMRAVNRGLARKERRVPARIGIDEKSVGKGHELREHRLRSGRLHRRIRR